MLEAAQSFQDGESKTQTEKKPDEDVQGANHSGALGSADQAGQFAAERFAQDTKLYKNPGPGALTPYRQEW